MTVHPPCKVCGSATDLQGCVDAGRSCEIVNGTYLPLTGIPVWYHRCLACGFLFTTDYDAWTPADFRREIYNADYGRADPDWLTGVRAKAGAKTAKICADQLGVTRVLDYGGGRGVTASELRADGMDAWSWDFLYAEDPPPKHSFPLVTCFECLEHTPTPRETLQDVLSFVAPGGRVLFTTMLLDGLKPQQMDFWYIAPRNGHVSIHTAASITRLFDDAGWSIGMWSDNTMIAAETAP